MGIFTSLATLLGSVEHAASKPTKLTTQSTPVTSNAQIGQAITAGTIGTLNQVMPTLVRGPLLGRFKDAFVEGARLRMSLLRQDLTDEQYAELISATEAWANKTYGWLEKDVSPYAAERFNFRNSLSMSYNFPGNHKPEIVTGRDNCITALAGWLQNLDMLMREPSLYPQK